MNNFEKDRVRHTAFTILPSIIRAVGPGQIDDSALVAMAFEIALEFFAQEKQIEEKNDRRETLFTGGYQV